MKQLLIPLRVYALSGSAGADPGLFRADAAIQPAGEKINANFYSAQI